MKKYKFLLLILFSTSFTGFAQTKTPQPLIINVLLDVDSNIYIEENKTDKNSIRSNVQKIVKNSPAFKYEGVIYRIFADGNLSHGTIIDVANLLLEAYKPLNTKIEKYLLDTKANNLDDPNWVQQLNKIDLKASKIN